MVASAQTKATALSDNEAAAEDVLAPRPARAAQASEAEAAVVSRQVRARLAADSIHPFENGSASRVSEQAAQRDWNLGVPARG